MQHLVDCRFSDNYQCSDKALDVAGSVAYGGAVYFASSTNYVEYVEQPPLFEYVLFEGNQCRGNHAVNNSGGTYAGDGGGAVYGSEYGTAMTFRHCEFVANSITNCTGYGNAGYNHYAHGGAVFTRGDFAAEDCVFTNNAGLTFGGTVFAGSATGGIRRCTFAGNYQCVPTGFANDSFCGISAGTVYFNLADFSNIVENCVFDGNVLYGRQGGAICQNAASTLVMSDTVIRDNLNYKGKDEAIAGAAVYVNNASSVALIDRCSFIGNRTEHYNLAQGGGLYLAGSGHVRNSLFDGNVVTNEANAAKNCGQGGGIFAAQAIEVSNCTFVNNVARYVGGGLYLGGKRRLASDGTVDFGCYQLTVTPGLIMIVR